MISLANAQGSVKIRLVCLGVLFLIISFSNIATHLQKIYKHFFFYKNSYDKSCLGMKLFIK